MFRRYAPCALLVLALVVPAAPAHAQTAIQETNTMAPTLDSFPSDPAGAIAAARGLIAEGKMGDAIKNLERYVAAHPRDLEPHRFLGDLYFRTGQVDRAKFTYQEILQHFPHDKETHNRLGTVYSVENDVDDAIAEFNAALPGTDSVSDLVMLHERKGDLPKYRQEIEDLANRYPNDPSLQSELAQVYDAIHEPLLALNYFQRALDQNPRELTALNGIGLAYLALHHYGEAIDAFQTCLSVQPRTYQCENNLGAAELNAGQYVAAKRTLDIAYRIAPERAETFVNYGYLDDALNRWRAAVAEYAKAIGIWPYQREAYIDIALDYESHNLYPLAQAALLKGIASIPDDGRMRFLLGRAYIAQGHRSEAAEQFRLASQGTDPDAARIAKTQLADLSPVATPTPAPQERSTP